MSSGGRRRTSGKAKESHLQRRTLWEYCRVDSCECPSLGNAATLKIGQHNDTHTCRNYFCRVSHLFFDLLFNISVIQAHWWAVLLMGIALIMLMAGFIKICSVHTPSSNPKLPPPKPLPGTENNMCLYLHVCTHVPKVCTVGSWVQLKERHVTCACWET